MTHIMLRKADEVFSKIDPANDTLVGRMDFDFADGRLANRFVEGAYYETCREMLGFEQLQAELNQLIFEQIKDLNALCDLIDDSRCWFEFELKDETLFYAETPQFVYYVRLIPLAHATNRIFAYVK